MRDFESVCAFLRLKTKPILSCCVMCTAYMLAAGTVDGSKKLFGRSETIEVRIYSFMMIVSVGPSSLYLIPRQQTSLLKAEEKMKNISSNDHKQEKRMSAT